MARDTQRKAAVSAQPSTTQPSQRLTAYGKHHLHTAKTSLQRQLQTPLSSMMTWLVLAISLALPASLYLALDNVQSLSVGWRGAAQISLYLQRDAADGDIQTLAERIRARGDVDQVEVINREQALEEFQRLSEFGEALTYLDENPLPPVLVVAPSAALQSADAAEALRNELLNKDALVEQAKLDMDWVQRLFSIVDLARRSVWALAILLAAGVLLIVGNTIRLAIENRREEILVVKLVGGTDGYVKRPFLYAGLWFGLGGGLIAWAIVTTLTYWLSGPVGTLASLYHSTFTLRYLSGEAVAALLAAGLALGWIGAWLAVNRHLKDIEPH